jgi:hypothetical protein
MCFLPVGNFIGCFGILSRNIPGRERQGLSGKVAAGT